MQWVSWEVQTNILNIILYKVYLKVLWWLKFEYFIMFTALYGRTVHSRQTTLDNYLQFSCALVFINNRDYVVNKFRNHHLLNKSCAVHCVYQRPFSRRLVSAPNHLIFVVPCIMLNSEINPRRCKNCVYSSQWLYSVKPLRRINAIVASCWIYFTIMLLTTWCVVKTVQLDRGSMKKVSIYEYTEKRQS